MITFVCCHIPLDLPLICVRCGSKGELRVAVRLSVRFARFGSGWCHDLGKPTVTTGERHSTIDGDDRDRQRVVIITIMAGLLERLLAPPGDHRQLMGA